MNSKKQYFEWSEESLTGKPELVSLFDRLARIGRAMQRARAKIDQQHIQQDNPKKTLKEG